MSQIYSSGVSNRSIQYLVALFLSLALLGTARVSAQISLPYVEDFSGISVADGFPSPSGGSWARSGSTTLQPTYISNQSTYNRFGHGDAKFMSFRYGQPTGGNVYTVGPFSLSAGTTYQVGVWYIADGLTGFGPLSLTYGTGTTLALQSNTIASVPANITNTSYTQMSGTFTPASSGSYYLGIKCVAPGTNPWYLSIDDFTVTALSPCSGTPAPGNTLASANPACANTPLTLSLQNAFTGSTGISYQWETSVNGTTWVPVTTGGTSATYTVTQTAATYYHAIVTCSFSSTSTTSTAVYVTQNPATSCYCIPVSTATGYYINNFATTGGIANISNLGSGDGVTSGGYSNYTTQTASALTGNTVSFSGSFGSSGTYTFGVKIYVDWNQDGDFTGTGESVYATTGYTTSFSGTFTVPTTALGGPTRMRVRADYNNGTGPASCGSITNGEAEDYTFNVILPVPCTGTPTPGISTAFSPVAVTGFNADVIANGVGAANTTTTADVDGGGYYFLDSTYQYTSASAIPTYALPANGIINSAATPGLVFNLRPSSSNNSLRITTTSGTGTLTLATPITATNLYLLATSGSGNATIDVTVTFTTAATQTFSGITINDWYGGTPFAATAIGRVTATNTQDGTSTNPRLYQIPLALSAANSLLTIASITVTRTSTAGFVQVLAVSAATTTPAAVCAGIASRTITMANPPSTTGITYQWQESATIGGPYTNVTTGSGATTLSYTTPVLTATRYYVLKVTCSNSSLSALTNEVAVVVNPQPTLSVTSLPASANICGTGSVSLTASGTGTSYAWFPATGLSATNVANPVASPTATTTYTVTATNNAGCTNTATKTVSVYGLTTITATANPSTLCAGGNTTLTAIDTNKGGAVMPTGYTNGTVTYPTTDEDFGTISFGSLSNTTSCGSLSGTIGTATGTAGSYSDFTSATPVSFIAGNSYSLSLSSLTCGTSNYSNAMAVYIDYNQNGVFTDAGETVYIATSTVSGPHTETATPTIPATAKTGVTRLRVIVNEGLVTGPQMSPGYGEIEDYSIRIIKPATVAAATGYTWSPGTFLASATGSPATVTVITSSTTYTVTGVDANGCSATATVAVTVNPLPAISVSPASAAICTGSSTTLTASGPSTTYSWSPATGLSATTGASVTANPTATTTYTITGTDANGCTNTVTKLVTVNALPPVAITPATATAICTGSSATLTATGASTYSWTPATGLSATTGATVAASPTATTTYTVTGTDANGCVNAASKLVTVNPLPPVAVSPGSATAICAGFSIALTASGATSYSWTPATGLSATTGATVTATPAATTTYTVTGTDANGCASTATKLVTVNALPIVNITPATALAICAGASVSLTANGATTYSWTPATGLSATTGATVTATPTATITYTVTGTNASGCVNTATKLVTVNALPSVNITPAAASTICAGASVALTASGATTYSWTPATGLSATTGAAVTATPAATTTYTVTGTDANGCVNAASKLITVNPLPPVAVSPATATTFCGSGSVVLTASGATTYSWTPATGLSAATGATVTASPTTTTTYTVTGTDANGCVNTATKLITINPLPGVTVTPATATTICSGNSVSLTASGATTYSWTPGTGLSATTGATVTASPTATTTYTVTGTDANGCVNTATKLVTVNTSPTVSISPATATAICAGGNVALTASGATSYSWTPATGLSATTGATVTATPASTITYTVTGTAANGCTGTATKLVTVNPLPSIVITPVTATAICAGSGVLLTASGGTTYSWTPGTGLSATTGATVTASPTATVTYTITGTDLNGCVNTATKTVTVNALPTVAISPSTATTICAGSSVPLTASGATTYSWSPAAGLSATTGATVNASPAATTTYTVVGTNANGCSSTATKIVTVNALPIVSISPATAIAVCAGSGATLTASGAISYTWTPATGLSATTGATVTATPAVTTTYTVTGTNINGCVNTASRTVTVNGLPTINISPLTTTTICEGSSVLLTATGAFTYSWTPASSLSSSAGATVIASPIVTTTYTVTGTAANGCTNTATKTVNVIPKPQSDFTPAGNITICQNDTVFLTATAGYTSYTWYIYGVVISSATNNVLPTGTGGFYTLKVVDTSGCVSTTAVAKVVTVNQRPIPHITANGATLNGGSGYGSYKWYLNGMEINGATSQSIVATQGGLYTVVVTDADSTGCTGTSLPYQFTALGLGNQSISDAIRLYPNPASGILNIDAPVPVSVTVSSMDGKQILFSTDARRISISEWADGVYRVVIRDKNGTYLKTEKITKLTK